MGTERLRQLLYAWHEHEQELKSREQAFDIIDFDLIAEKRPAPQSRADVLQQLSTHPDPYINAKIVASKTFLQRLLGERLPFSEYARNTIGVAPQIIPESYLQELKQKVASLYKDLGYQYTKEDLERFRVEQRLAPEQIESEFNKARDEFLPKFMEWLGVEVPIEYKIRFVNEDVYWINWISTDNEGNFLLRYNTHERHFWLKGAPEMLMMHEICGHYMQGMSWKRAIQRGELDPCTGLTAVFTPDAFNQEGIAQALPAFLPEIPFSPHGRLNLYAQWLGVSVWNNVHIWLHEGQDREDLKKYLWSYLPALVEKTADKSLETRMNDPLMSTYEYVYGISLFHHLNLASRLSADEKKSFVQNTYRRPLLPEEIINWKL